MCFGMSLSLCLTLELGFAIKLYQKKKKVLIAFFYWPSPDTAREPSGKRGFVFVKDGRWQHQGTMLFPDSFDKSFYILKISRYVF